MTIAASPALPEDKRLARLSKLCLALPGTTREDSKSHTTFRVRKKIFAYFLNEHDPDGIVSVCVKSELGENVDRAGAFPEIYYLPPYIGAKGWFGLRLDRGTIDWNEVANVVSLSYHLSVPASPMTTPASRKVSTKP